MVHCSSAGHPGVFMPLDLRLTRHARVQARRRGVPLDVVSAVYQDPDGIRPSTTLPDREVRWRLVGDLVVEVVVDMTDGWIVTVWVKDRR